MTNSTIPAVKTDLISRLETALPTVQILYAWDGQTVENESVYFLGATFTHRLPTIRSGRRTRDEEFRITLVIDTSVPGRTAETAEARAFEIFAELEDIIADAPTLGGLVEVIHLGEEIECGVSADGEGYGGLIRVVLYGRQRLT